MVTMAPVRITPPLALWGSDASLFTPSRDGKYSLKLKSEQLDVSLGKHFRLRSRRFRQTFLAQGVTKRVLRVSKSDAHKPNAVLAKAGER